MSESDRSDAFSASGTASGEQNAAGQAPSPYVHLTAAGRSLWLKARGGERPRIVHWGAELDCSSPAELETLTFSQPSLGSALRFVHGSLSNEPGTGIATSPGLLVQRKGTSWAVDLRVVNVVTAGETHVTITCEDANSSVRAEYLLDLEPDTGVLRARTRIANMASNELAIEWCAAPILPVDRRLDQITGFAGRWAGEFQPEPVKRFRGSYLRENRAGRTSHDAFPALLLGAECTGERSGYAAAFHLAWSGNSRLRVDTSQDGRAFLQAGELLLPGEVTLPPGEAYETPELIATGSETGFGPVSRALHDHVRNHLLDKRTSGKARPVHYNTWEAVYFDHDEARIKQLAERAAAVGAERFVLDDGWFGSRRNDATGLGDWWVSPDIYPNGLRPLADQVRSLGMEFGLWFEPEMVNPDSDLYREHPDWVLGADGVEHLPFRNQLTLDLTRPEVIEHLYERIAAIVADAGVDYIKWDMNRDTVHPASGERGAMHRQTRAVYSLIKRLRDRFPELEIESCASGGARADYGVLNYTDRIWTSDNNDALDRQSMQRAASHFLPLSIMGSHVGPKRCHITGRVLDMPFRVATSIFGHMGMEVDLEEESEEDIAILARGIALHKQHRELLHQGDFHRLELPEPFNAVASVARDGSEAIVSCAMIDTLPTSLPPRLQLPMLDHTARYRLQLVWPEGAELPGGRSIVHEADLSGAGLFASGAALAEIGFQIPIMHPNTCLIFHCTRQ